MMNMTNYIRVEKDLLSKGITGKCLNLYLLMLDRASVSYKNNWKTAEGVIYIIMKVKEISEMLGVCKRTASSLLNTLEDAALITRKKQGLGKPNLILMTYCVKPVYTDNMAHTACDVKENEETYNNFNEVYNEFHESYWDNILEETSCERALSDLSDISISEKSENYGTTLSTDHAAVVEKHEVIMPVMHDEINVDSLDTGAHQNQGKKMHLQKCNNLHFQKCKKLHLYNNINNSNINIINNTNNIYHLSESVKEDDVFLKKFKQNIDYSIIMMNPDKHYGQILSVIMNVVSKMSRSTSRTYRVAGNNITRNRLCSRLLMLDSSHIEYVIECIQGSSTLIRNMSSYILTCLFNAPETIDDYYEYQVMMDRMLCQKNRSSSYYAG